MTDSTDGGAVCAVCQNRETRPWRTAPDNLLGSSETFSAVRCVHCGTVRLFPRPSAEAMSRHYTPLTYARAEGDADTELGKRLDAIFAHQASRTITALGGQKKGDLLDVGCGDGRYLAAMARLGWKGVGIETDAVAATLARNRAHTTVWETPLETAPIPPESFDLVSFLHVMEHVSDPRAVLESAHRALRPGGSVLIAVPNAASLEAHLFGASWYHPGPAASLLGVHAAFAGTSCRGKRVSRHVPALSAVAVRAAKRAQYRAAFTWETKRRRGNSSRGATVADRVVSSFAARLGVVGDTVSRRDYGTDGGEGGQAVKDALIGPLLLLDVFCGAYGIGCLLLGRVGRNLGRGERVLFAVPLGMGVLGYLLLAFGLARLFRTPIFVALLIACVAGAAVLLRDLLAKPTPKIQKRPANGGVIAACGVILGLIGIGTFIAALAPPSGLEWDALSYHLAAPKVFLREGRVFFLPYDHHSNFPFTLQMLYTLMLGVGSVAGAKLCHWLCGALLVASIYTFGAQHCGTVRGRTIGAIAAVLVAATPMVVWEATVAYVDLATSLFTWLSLYALFNAAQASGVLTDEEPPPNGLSVPWLIVSAVLMGFALGTKYTVFAYWGFLLIGIVGWHYAVTRRWAKETLPHAAIWGGVSLLVASPWYVKNILTTGNPVYPFAYGLFGGRYWSAHNAALYTADQAKLGLPKTPVNLLLNPWQATMLPDALPFTEYITFALSPIFVALVIAALLMGKRLSRQSWYLLLFGIGAYAAWFFSVQQTRYLLPGLPALALVGAEVLVVLWETSRLTRYAAALTAALSVAWGLYLAGGLAFWGVEDVQGNRAAAPAWPVVSGQMSADEFIHRRAAGYGPAEQWINANTPPNTEVGLFDETRGYYLDRAYAWATPNHAAGLFGWDTYTSADDWLRDFKRRGYTVLLIGAVPPSSQNDGQQWRVWLPEAVQSGALTLIDEEPAGSTLMPGHGQEPPVRVPLTVRVYQIR